VAARTIDAPKWEWGTTIQASRWLGVHEDTFLTLAADHPWLQPVKIGKRGIRWYWLDMVCLSRIMQRMPVKEKSEEENSSGGSRRKPTKGDGGG